MNEASSLMDPEEAKGWLKKHSRDLAEAEESFPKWSPEVIVENPEHRALIEGALVIAWEKLKEIRAPCFEHRQPAVLLRTEPVTVVYDGEPLDRAPVLSYLYNVHVDLPDQIREEDCDIPTALQTAHPEEFVAQRIFKRFRLSLSDLDGMQICGGWTSDVKKRETRQRCPKCGEYGSGISTGGNSKRFYHERNPPRSCYLGPVTPKLKRNPTVKCLRCGREGRQHLGKDGYMRIRHSDKTCYIG